jgi:PAS domain S-box-containing protein
MERADRYQASHPDDERYRLLVEGITDYAIYMLDPAGRVTSWNPGAQRFKGYVLDEILGEHFSRFYTEEDRAAGAPARALGIARSEGRFEQEGWRVRKDGTRFWAHVIIDAVRGPAGDLIGFAKVTRDLTERRATEEALRRSEEQFRLLVQSVTDYAIYMLDPGGRVTNWNPGAQRIKGYAPDEIIGRHFSTFYTDEDRAAGLPALGLETAAREGRWEHEGWRVRKDGARFWAHVVIDAVRDDRGQPIGFAKVTRDVTERLQAQQELDRAREALFQAQKMDAIGQLTGGVAHDFNNLLMAVLGSLELVRKRLPYDPRITPLIENAVQGAERGAILTRRMLAFARKQELALVAVDLPALTRGMIGFLQRTLGPGVKIEMRFEPGLPKVQTDPNQLETALLNLAVNARDAMPDGGLITISGEIEAIGAGHPDLTPGAYVRLAVADTGAGMDADTVARAMEPFFTTKGVGKGTGLGLPMVHGLAMQSGGALEITSRPGVGTVVSLWMPVADVGMATQTAFAAPRAAPAQHHRPLTILTVDDDGLVLMNTAALLEDLGHHVVQATSAREALEALKLHPDFDLLITDQAMPQMTGLQLAQAIRAERPALPVILATGYAEIPPGAGADFVRLAKPFTQDELAQAVIAAVPA